MSAPALAQRAQDTTPVRARYWLVDVFSDRAGHGNPLAIVHGAGLDAESMQRMASWFNLSETVFITADGDAADYAVRIFTPMQELPFAGHPSVGAAWAARRLGWIPAGQAAARQRCAAGVLDVAFDADGLVRVRTPTARRIDASADSVIALFASGGGLAPGALQPALWDIGPHWWVVELADERAVRRLRPDVAAMRAVADDPRIGFAVFAATDAPSAHQVVVRAFCPADGIPEDPVTGSANAAIASALLHAGRIAAGGPRYLASQGRELGRDGTVHVDVGPDGAVWIGGQVVPVIEAALHW